MSGVQILLDSNRGVYIPQHFAEIVQAGMSWEGYDSDDIDALLQGPDSENYWEVWEDVYSNTVFVDSNGNRWCLWQDGDLFIYCEQLMTAKEYENLFGEPRPE
jgi:hypothetical protein